ncbi:MAG: hypothetical protein ACI9HK_004662, partial [Pirellulaceae bacterium]
MFKQTRRHSAWISQREQRLRNRKRASRLQLEHLEDRRLLAFFGPANEVDAAPNVEAGGVFGTSVAASEEIVFVGSPGATAGGLAAAGTVSVMVRDDQGNSDPSDDTWAQPPAPFLPFAAPTPEAAAGFGTSVAWSDPFIVVGAPGQDDVGTDRGAVYVINLAPVFAGGAAVFH